MGYITKNLKLGMVAFAMLVFSSLAMGQTAIVDYMRIKPGDDSKYLAVEKEWMKIHEARLKAGKIISWTLYQNMYAGADEGFQYATVTIYKDFAATEEDSYTAASKEAYPDYSDKDWDKFFARTEESRVLGSSEVFHRVTGTDPKLGASAVYLDIDAMRVKPGGSDSYESLEKDIYKKLQESRVKDGEMQVWSIWAKWPGNQTDYQYVAVNSYTSIAQMMKGDYAKTLKKVFPAMKPAELAAKTNAARTQTESWLWKKIETVQAN